MKVGTSVTQVIASCAVYCARTVQKSIVFIALGLALSEKQIPQIIENIGNHERGRSY